ncbi:hypothetical protein SLEP1_g1292 [Rubroshorea leprosula]|uniref:BZIP domain-containing protein n=1 Tax=Rubroshorea leprosula TaxID=152421 RepID=A0AAV5HK44_9ROSI|nr:hypothetical protein SLEP1_g1292 [Rubroshorea leprosula]
MAGARKNRQGRLRRVRRALKKMKRKAAAKREELGRLRDETAQMEFAVEQLNFEKDLLRMLLEQHSNDNASISATLDSITQAHFN